jgi:hypothetical protein
MTNISAAQAVVSPSRSAADRLNQTCFCITLDRDALCGALEREAGDREFCAAFIGTRSMAFCASPTASAIQRSHEHRAPATAGYSRLLAC